MRNKIALVSDIEIERQYFVDSIVDVDQVAFINEVRSQTGSKVINAGRVMASTNEVVIYGAVGDDVEAKVALTDLKRYQFDTSSIQTIKGEHTGQVIVFTDRNGKSAINVYLGASDSIDTNIDFDNCQILYTATSLPLPKLYSVLEKAKSKSIVSFLDIPNKQSEFDKRYLRNVDYVMPNRQEAGLMLDQKVRTIRDAVEASRKLLDFGSECTVITLDKDGCVVFTRTLKEPIHLPAPQMVAKDETGSGDIFRGVFVNEISKNKDVVEVAKKAVSMASKAVSIKGVNESIAKTLEHYENSN